ncbi:DUF4192 domain-containing protein [Bifidobacterium sp. UBA744]|uniref:DUF4192 domain-containing protein n=1 Tax=Bifidobacterium sp. UBA744 TaxID=1946112 RepID=UPI0025BCF95D|nr:DUF4192 domain-containing protein [Bifidobacterium sp. UBA744]
MGYGPCTAFSDIVADSSCDYDSERFEDAELEELTLLFRDRRRDMGAEAADMTWFVDPLDAWLACLDNRRRGLDRESIAYLAVGMRGAVSMRDALIVSLISAQTDRERLMQLGVRPHRPANSSYLGRVLGSTFDDAEGRPDAPRCSRGLGMLVQMVRSVPDAYGVQPMAVIAYVLWWVGDIHAGAYAVRALAMDGRCTLALIVLAALEHGIAPAWVGPSAASVPGHGGARRRETSL